MADLTAVFPGDSELARRMRAFDWGSSPLGAPDGWPQELRATVRTLLASLSAEFDARELLLARLGDVLQTIADPIEIQLAAARTLATHLDLGRAFYFSVERDAGQHVYVVEQDYAAVPGAPSMIGRHRQCVFGEAVLADLARGRAVAVPDVNRPSVLTEAERPAYHALQVESFVAVPLIKHGEYVAGFFVLHSSPREWPAADAELIEETAERTWAALRRASADGSLRESEAKYRGIFNSIDEGFSLLDVQFDENGAASDVIIRDANPAQERVDAVRGLIGSRVRGLLPHLEMKWIERYADVARTGEPAHFEDWSAANQRWYEIKASRVGDPGSTLVATVYTDVTKRRRHERRLAVLAEITKALASGHNLEFTLAKLAEKIGRFFEARSCVLAELRHEREPSVASYDWHADENTPAAPIRPMREFLDGNNLGMPLSDRPVVVNDTVSDPRTADGGYDARGIRSLVIVPMPQPGPWQFQLTVSDDTPREWNEDDVALLHEVTGRVWSTVATVRAEQSLRRSEGRNRFLLEVSDLLRVLDPVSIPGAACRLLRTHFGIARAMYAEFGSEGLERELSAAGQYESDPPAPALSQPFVLREIEQLVDNGEPFVADDMLAHPSVRAVDRALFESAGVRALLAATVVKRGHTVGRLVLHHSAPRTWTSADIALVQDVAERTWTACARARTESLLRIRETQLSRLNEQLEERVAARTSQIQRLFGRLIEAQETERRRFARDLHDQLGQHLTALRMHLDALQTTANGNQALATQTGLVQRLASDLDDSIDFLTWQLRPATLDEFGLAAALHHLVASWSERFGIPASFELVADEGRHLESDAEMNLYRLAQEALHNVVKHAGATSVTVQLQRSSDLVLLVIQDNGQGFDSKRHDLSAGGLGLVSMRERATLAGGRLEVQSSPGAGTSIVVRVFRDAAV